MILHFFTLELQALFPRKLPLRRSERLFLHITFTKGAGVTCFCLPLPLGFYFESGYVNDATSLPASPMATLTSKHPTKGAISWGFWTFISSFSPVWKVSLP